MCSVENMSNRPKGRLTSIITLPVSIAIYVCTTSNSKGYHGKTTGIERKQDISPENPCEQH